MSLSKQKTYSRDELFYYFDQVYDRKLIRRGLQSNCHPQDWELQAFMDGPLTFVAITHITGVTFTGWSKFNANDNKYTEHGGLFRAFQKAVDKYAQELAYQSYRAESKMFQQESATDEVCSNQSSGLDQ